jgi:hypothetical protein
MLTKKEIKSHKLRRVGRDDKNINEWSKRKALDVSFRVKGSEREAL